MIISYYGKKFLKRYNEVEGKNLTPKQFFVEVFYPQFFLEKKSLIHVQNSPFNNPSYKNKTAEEKLNLFLQPVSPAITENTIMIFLIILTLIQFFSIVFVNFVFKRFVILIIINRLQFKNVS